MKTISIPIDRRGDADLYVRCLFLHGLRQGETLVDIDLHFD